MSSKRFFICAVCVSLVLLVLFAGLTVYIDPFFHYHAPIDGISYRLTDQRHQNDGILRHYTYDSVIIGTSMTQNFKPSEFDALFDANSIKVPFSGAYLNELGENLRTGFDSGNEIKRVLMSLDLLTVIAKKDALQLNYEYPEYLYDDNIFNDVKYFFNKRVLLEYTLEDVRRTLSGQPTTSLDEYSNWSDSFKYGMDAVIADFEKSAIKSNPRVLNDQYIDRIRDNIETNLLSVTREHKDTEFIIFIPPYSIVKMYAYLSEGSLDFCFDVYKEAARMLLSMENVRLFSFYDDNELVCDLDNYRDMTHYGEWINTHILECIKDGEHELYSDTYAEYFDRISEYYREYDYSYLFD